ncbi:MULTISPECIES: hypothetical protein [Saccharothrix]|uniref:hypothetical protein n=1 Tax=Saccharothrix TaxID=2071 RepID=UPI00093F5B3F|nr:hypothetical protein [Saccharothrix sp. CB00851]OKI32037.1 hypothetical protein A6A25_26725 [Saccharothrix sp. CB00851]
MTLIATSSRRSLITFAVITLTAVASLVAIVPQANAATSQFRGMNWAVLGDNFSTGALVVQGLSQSDSNATVRAKANALYDDMAATMGVNTVRLPINTHTVANTTWWNGGGVVADHVEAAPGRGVDQGWSDGRRRGGGGDEGRQQRGHREKGSGEPGPSG